MRRWDEILKDPEYNALDADGKIDVREFYIAELRGEAAQNGVDPDKAERSFVAFSNKIDPTIKRTDKGDYEIISDKAVEPDAIVSYRDKLKEIADNLGVGKDINPTIDTVAGNITKFKEGSAKDRLRTIAEAGFGMRPEDAQVAADVASAVVRAPENLVEGVVKRSGTGMYTRTLYPEVFDTSDIRYKNPHVNKGVGGLAELSPTSDEFMKDLGGLIGDVPLMFAGGAISGLGSAARTAGLQRMAESIGAFSVPAQVKRLAIEKMERGGKIGWGDLPEVVPAVFVEGAKQIPVGVATAGAGMAVEAGAKALGAGGHKILAEIADKVGTKAAELFAMTTAAAAVEGRLPTKEEYIAGGGQIAAYELAMALLKRRRAGSMSAREQLAERATPEAVTPEAVKTVAPDGSVSVVGGEATPLTARELLSSKANPEGVRTGIEYVGDPATKYFEPIDAQMVKPDYYGKPPSPPKEVTPETAITRSALVSPEGTITPAGERVQRLKDAMELAEKAEGYDPKSFLDNPYDTAKSAMDAMGIHPSSPEGVQLIGDMVKYTRAKNFPTPGELARVQKQQERYDAYLKDTDLRPEQIPAKMIVEYSEKANASLTDKYEAAHKGFVGAMEKASTILGPERYSNIMKDFGVEHPAHVAPAERSKVLDAVDMEINQRIGKEVIKAKEANPESSFYNGPEVPQKEPRGGILGLKDKLFATDPQKKTSVYADNFKRVSDVLNASTPSGKKLVELVYGQVDKLAEKAGPYGEALDVTLNNKAYKGARGERLKEMVYDFMRMDNAIDIRKDLKGYEGYDRNTYIKEMQNRYKEFKPEEFERAYRDAEALRGRISDPLFKEAEKAGIKQTDPAKKNWEIELISKEGPDQGRWKVVDGQGEKVRIFKLKEEAKEYLDSVKNIPIQYVKGHVPLEYNWRLMEKEAPVITKHLIDTGQMAPERTFKLSVDKFKNEISEYATGERKAGSLQHGREFFKDIPDKYLVKKIDYLLSKYITDSAKKLSELEYYGPKDVYVSKVISDIKKEGGDYEYAQKAFDAHVGQDVSKMPQNTKDLLSSMRSLNVIGKMPLSFISQTTQHITALIDTNLKSFAKMMWVRMAHGKEAREEAIRSGALFKGVVDQAVEGMNGRTGRLETSGQIAGALKGTAEWLLRNAYLFNKTDLSSREAAYLCGKFYTIENTRKLQKAWEKGSPGAIKKYEERLRDYGIDPARVRENNFNLSEADLLRAGRWSTRRTNFDAGVFDKPRTWSTELGASAAQFMTFQLENNRWVGRVLEKCKREKNPYPILMLAVFGGAANDIVTALRDLLMGRAERGEAKSVIMGLATGNIRDEWDLASRIAEDYASGGYLHFSGKIVQALQHNIESFNPTLGDIGQTLRGLNAAFAPWVEKHSYKDLAKAPLGITPYGAVIKSRFLKEGETRLATPQEQAKRDIADMRKAQRALTKIPKPKVRVQYRRKR